MMPFRMRKTMGYHIVSKSQTAVIFAQKAIRIILTFGSDSNKTKLKIITVLLDRNVDWWLQPFQFLSQCLECDIYKNIRLDL